MAPLERPRVKLRSRKAVKTDCLQEKSRSGSPLPVGTSPVMMSSQSAELSLSSQERSQSCSPLRSFRSQGTQRAEMTLHSSPSGSEHEVHDAHTGHSKSKKRKA